MALIAHKTVTMFMGYVHTEDDPIRAAAETVAARRKSVVTGTPPADPAPLLRRRRSHPSQPSDPG